MMTYPPQGSHLLPGDKDWQADKALVSELTPIIAQLSTYVVRYLDADAGKAEPISVDDERALGERVTALGAGLQARAERREALGERPVRIEGRVALPPAIEDR
jgi:hypothetical protein